MISSNKVWHSLHLLCIYMSGKCACACIMYYDVLFSPLSKKQKTTQDMIAMHQGAGLVNDDYLIITQIVPSNDS